MKFLEGVTKDLKKAGIEEGSSGPPRWWISCGNYVANYIMSGNFHGMIPQGRITGLAGPAGAGKSFIAANLMREAQKEGCHIVVLDSENALDDDFVGKIGVDTEKDYLYFPVVTNAQVENIVAKVVGGYKDEYGDDPDAPKLIIVLDSLDMLLTEKESDDMKKGVQKGDQGQRNKQNKAMLRKFVHPISNLNISIVITCQVYENQDLMNGEGRWIVSGAVKFALSQIALLTKLKLKNTGEREVQGIRMKITSHKTRFTKPFQEATIEVPYETGMDPYNGLLDAAVSVGVVIKKGSRYALASDPDNTFYSKNFGEYAPGVLETLSKKEDTFLSSIIASDVEEEGNEDGLSVKERRIKNAS
jgi:RecA/RadA recombinase